MTRKLFENQPSLSLLVFNCILTFLSPAHLFKYFKRRYSKDQIAFLNSTLGLRGKLNSVLLNLCFLHQCSVYGVAPKRIQARVRKAKVYHSLKIEKAFLKDETDRCQQRLTGLRRKFTQHLRDTQVFLSHCDYLRFARLISQCDVKQRKRDTERNERNLTRLRKGRYGSFCVSHDTIINLSDVELTALQKDILCRGPHFGVPRNTRPEEVLCEFELFYRKLSNFVPRSLSAVAQCRSSLEALAHEYVNTKLDLKTFSLGREHLKVLKELRNNNDLVVTRPDKGRATVVMNRQDYVMKMLTILNDQTKFQKLGPSSTHDKTAGVESSLNKFLCDLKKSGEIPSELYESIRSTGGTRPRMYGVPKIHKDGAPLRPILSMAGSPQYNVSQWLCKVLEPVRAKYNRHCIKDTFQFIDILKEKSQNRSGGFMCSFDVVSLFTNVPLDETIEICADVLYRDDDVEPVFTALSEKSFCNLMRQVTSGVEFSFDDMMYRQKDGVAMGSPLGPVLADIFVGWCESRIPADAWPHVYCRFVDDSFGHFDKRKDIDRFLCLLNNLHPALRFTCEHENDGRLPYLDVLVENGLSKDMMTSVYRKPTFTGLYITWDSFCATKYKINLVKNLVERAHRICSDSKLDEELVNLKSIFMKNGYPLGILDQLVKRRPDRMKDPPFGPKRCPLYLRLPWKGPRSSSIAKTIASTARSTYNAVDVTCVFTTSRAFNLRKDALPTHQKSNLIYEFECRNCSSRYVGRTAQRLSSRIRQHVPLHLLPSGARSQRPTRGRPRLAEASSDDIGGENDGNDDQVGRTSYPRSCKKTLPKSVKKRSSNEYQSAIARHLVESRDCALAYDDNSFRVLYSCSSECYLEVLEALFIWSLSPDLCVQKSTVSSLQLFRPFNTPRVNSSRP